MLYLTLAEFISRVAKKQPKIKYLEHEREDKYLFSVHYKEQDKNA